MEINLALTGIGISYGINFILLYTRKQKWNSNQFRWILTSAFLIIGISGLIEVVNINDKDFHFFSWCLITPFIYNILDRSFKKISEIKYNRDFYLWLSGSHEIDDSFFGKNPHVNSLDIFFSMVLLFAIIFLPVIGKLLGLANIEG